MCLRKNVLPPLLGPESMVVCFPARVARNASGSGSNVTSMVDSCEYITPRTDAETLGPCSADVYDLGVVVDLAFAIMRGQFVTAEVWLDPFIRCLVLVCQFPTLVRHS